MFEALRRRDFTRICLFGGGAYLSTPQKVLVLGDSLSAEYGISKGTGWVALLSEKLKQLASPYEVINASISGETTSGGLTRLPQLLENTKPQVVLIELGANDALRGLSLKLTQSNLEKMALLSRQAKAKVVLIGIQVPPNYGPQYNEELRSVFAKVAKEQRCTLVPFLFAGLERHLKTADPNERELRNWFQDDQLHPLAKAHPYILEGLWPSLEKILTVSSH
jgi:acyl-CoA thioesterase-1